MRYLPNLALTALLTILLTSCANSSRNYYTETVDSWHGGNINTLVQHWGTPDDKTISPNGSSVYLYKTASYHNSNQPASPGIGVNYSHSSSSPVITSYAPNTNMTWNRGAMSLTCTAQFSVNKAGIITDTKIQGNSCYANQSFAEQKMNPSRKIKKQPSV